MAKFRLIHNSHSFEKAEPCVATIGNFDALHLGHQQIIRQVLIKAKALKVVPTVITFEPLPQTYLRPQDPLFRLLTLRQKIQLLKEWGIEQVICLRFNQDLARLSPQGFIQTYLVEKLKVQCLVVGENFRFGHQQAGDINTLHFYGQQENFEVISLCLKSWQQKNISSTAVREAFIAGDMTTVTRLLGREYSIEQRVARGVQRGRQLGFPTANLPLRNRPLVKGVFITKIFLQNQIFFGLTNIGTRPTVDGKNYLAEVHILDFCGDLYGQRLTIVLLHKIRDEIQFSTVEQLQQQILKDILNAKQWLKPFLVQTNEMGSV